MPNALLDHNIQRVFHILPLHYMPFVARSGVLKSKVHLRAEGFADSHFRSTSAHLDIQRGFGDYIHLSTVGEPPILKAKLGAGFPHVALSIPTRAMTELPFDLCRFNIAKTRSLRREGALGHKESPENGYYFESMQIPIARTHQQKRDLIQHNASKMLEVLVKDPISLDRMSLFYVFNDQDRIRVDQILQNLGVNWTVELVASPAYPAKPEYRQKCDAFIEKSLADSTWQGNGLEFDRV